MPKRPITPEDLLRLKFVSDPQVRPDGSNVIFTVKVIDAEKNKYFTHLWIVPSDGSAPERQFTFGEVSDSSPRWSPDGERIAFFRTKDQQTQVWTIAAGGGEAQQLTRMDEGALSSLAWSPDGTRLLFCFARTPDLWTKKAREEREKNGKSTPARVIAKLTYRLDGFGFLGEPSHVWVAEAKTGTAKQITGGDPTDPADFDDESPCWSPDGKSIAFISNRSKDRDDKPFEEDVWVVPAKGGKLRRVLRRVPTPPGYKGGLAWSPDGKHLAYIGVETQEDPWTPKNSRVWIVGADGRSKAQNLTASLDRAVGNMSISDTREAFSGGQPPIWSHDSRRLICTVSDCGACHLYTVSTAGCDAKPLTRGAIDVAAVSADRKTTRFALAQGNALDPGEIHLLANGQSKQLTHLNKSLLNQLRLSRPQEVWFQSGDLKIQGWIVKPPDFNPRKKFPLLLSVHGGPHAQYGHCFFHQFQVHAAEGYVVFYLNPRGSMGREEEFAACIKGDWGNLDYIDVMAAADYCDTLPYVDSKRTSISGGSYGGYMTNWVVGHTNRFKCAITDRSVVNMHSMAGTSDFVFRGDGYWKGNMWDNPQPLLDQSPLSYMKHCKTPLLIIHSEGDLRCPIGQADELYATLKRLHRTVEYVRYPPETPHGMSRTGPPDLRLDRLRRYGDWFAKYLKK